MMSQGNVRTRAIVQDLYRLVERLESAYPGRRFTLEGHLVGSLGEVLAAEAYGLVLLPSSSARHDAQSPEGRSVQIKATQRDSVGLTGEPQMLLVIQIHRDGSFSEVYNGPGDKPWSAAGKLQKNNQRRITLARLRSLMSGVPRALRLNRVAA